MQFWGKPNSPPPAEGEGSVDPVRGNGAREALKAALPNVPWGPIDELLATTLWRLGFKVFPLTSDDVRDGA